MTIGIPSGYMGMVGACWGATETYEPSIEHVVKAAVAGLGTLTEIARAFTVDWPQHTITVEGVNGGEHTVVVDHFVGDVVYELLRPQWAPYVKRIIIEPIR